MHGALTFDAKSKAVGMGGNSFEANFRDIAATPWSAANFNWLESSFSPRPAGGPDHGAASPSHPWPRRSMFRPRLYAFAKRRSRKSSRVPTNVGGRDSAVGTLLQRGATQHGIG